MRLRRDEQGSATILVLGCLLACFLVVGLWVQTARAGLARQRAETAGDLAALAAAAAVTTATGDEPCAVAASVARSNGAYLESCELDGSAGVEVTVRVSVPVTARSRAYAGPAAVQ